MEDIKFSEFPSIPRLSKPMVVTEKIDGTNACVYVSDDGLELRAASRTRWITPSDDNYGFAKWVEKNREELLTLGPGYHFGEWWGGGCQRGYGLLKGEKRFSLFNVHRWRESRPACCHLVPVLYEGQFETEAVDNALAWLKVNGSLAAPGFMNPEGVVVFHTASRSLFKKTFDDSHKGTKS